jgi:hypothetical protein
MAGVERLDTRRQYWLGFNKVSQDAQQVVLDCLLLTVSEVAIKDNHSYVWITKGRLAKICYSNGAEYRFPRPQYSGAEDSCITRRLLF